ncbi:MAG: hypothetical protein AB1405_10180, partial [Bdellovibrionota bacterium]
FHGHLPRQGDHRFFEDASGFVQIHPASEQRGNMAKMAKVFSRRCGVSGALGYPRDDREESKKKAKTPECAHE